LPLEHKQQQNPESLFIYKSYSDRCRVKREKNPWIGRVTVCICFIFIITRAAHKTTAAARSFLYIFVFCVQQTKGKEKNQTCIRKSHFLLFIHRLCV
jgi:hypothetical protein